MSLEQDPFCTPVPSNEPGDVPIGRLLEVDLSEREGTREDRAGPVGKINRLHAQVLEHEEVSVFVFVLFEANLGPEVQFAREVAPQEAL